IGHEIVGRGLLQPGSHLVVGGGGGGGGGASPPMVRYLTFEPPGARITPPETLSNSDSETTSSLFGSSVMSASSSLDFVLVLGVLGLAFDSIKFQENVPGRTTSYLLQCVLLKFCW